MASVHAALLGLQHPHSRAHLHTLQALPEILSISLWDPDSGVLDAVRASQGAKIRAVHTDLNALLADQKIFFAIAAVRNDLDSALCIRVLDAGKHLLAEKPIGRTAVETELVVAKAASAKVALGVCYPNRANPAVLEACRLVRAGVVGPLTSVEMRVITTQVQFRDPGHWLFRSQTAGGGILSWLACHNLDMMRYITGDEIISVAAETAIRSGESIDVEDVAVLSLRFRSGALGSLHTGYMLTQSGEGYRNSSGYDMYAGVNGRCGRIHWTSAGAPTDLTVESIHPDWVGAPRRSYTYELAKTPSYLGGYGEQFVASFVRAAQQETTPWASGADALQVARIVDAAYLSSRSGMRVAVTLPAEND